MRILRYDPSRMEQWDQFVRESKNGTFLFERGYMDYHSDRFADHSLMVLDARDELVALLPGTPVDGTLASHAGLTYGGFVTGRRMTTPAMLAVFEGALAHLRAAGFTRLRYKSVPHIYHAYPAEEDLYALFRCEAKLCRRDVLTVVPQDRPVPYQERRMRKIRQAGKAGVTVAESADFGAFWAILEANLARVHGVRPVHSLEEITLLAGRFPGNIHLHVASDAAGPVAGPVAGAVIYDSGRVAHVQYIGSNDRGREVGALDLLFSTLLEREYASRRYFDFGIANEEEGRVLNVGLIDQKEGFGARAVAHDYYELALA